MPPRPSSLGMPTEFEIDTPLSPKEALSRVAEHVGGDLPLLMLPISHSERPLRGSVDESGFDVRLKTTYANSFAAVCRAIVEGHANGSRVRARIGMPASTVVFLVVWLSGIAIIGFQALPRRDVTSVLTVLGMLVAGALILTVGRFLARREARGLEAMLRQILDVES